MVHFVDAVIDMTGGTADEAKPFDVFFSQNQFAGFVYCAKVMAN